MTEVVAPPRRKLSGWQLRERMKNAFGNSREELTQSEGTASTTSLQASDPGDDEDLPPAFRSMTGVPKLRRISSLRPQPTPPPENNLRRVNSLRPPKTQQIDRGDDNAKRSKNGKEKEPSNKVEAAPAESKSNEKVTKSSKKEKSKVKNKAKGTTETKKSKSLPEELIVENPESPKEFLMQLKEDPADETIPEGKEVSLPERRLSKVQRRQRSETRKTSVLDSVGKLEATGSFNQKYLPKRGNSAALKRNPYAPKTPEPSDDASIHSLSLDSLPPPDREERQAQSMSDKLSFHRSAQSFHRSTSSFDASLDLSGHRMLPVYEQITTSATDEQWARFKLLGRLGLGDIKLSTRAEELVDRNYGIMLNAIKHIYALRDEDSDNESVESMDAENIRTGKLLEEVQATIQVSTEGPSRLKRDPNKIQVHPEVQKQLRDYIVVIASMYRDNAFHDFEHASNVLLNVDKLIGLVQKADETMDYRNLKHGYGVATDPWNHFALVYSAMIHDVDHNGVPNAQLIKERAHVAGAYKNKSVAEQNSIELAWNLLMEPCYKELRESIFHYRSELTNFRSLVVTAVMATDIADKELAALRKGRAADALKAEEEDMSISDVTMDLVRRKATFVVETLIQVADVSHTMSSFAVFKKWNHRLYREMYKAYKSGRADQDPTDTWYKGEFGFFDFYIIPLSKKLNDCGIYGEASEEYTKNAIENRRLWEEKGEGLVAKYIKERDAEEGASAKPKPKETEEPPKAGAEPTKKTTISLREMAEWLSSSESEAGDDFGGDNDSVSISDGSEGRRRRESTHSGRITANLADMREYLKAMSVGGRVPSKASLEMKKDRRIVYRSRSSDERDLANNGGPEPDDRRPGMRIRVRSRSPASVPDMRLRQRSASSGSESENSEPCLPLRSRSRSRSPGSVGSEHSEPRPIVKIRALSRSPGSDHSQQRSILKRIDSPGSGSEAGETKSSAERSRPKVRISASPASAPEQKREQRHSRAGKVVRKGRRPSRSRSPASSVDRALDDAMEAEKDLKRGKRPSMLKARAKSTSNL